MKILVWTQTREEQMKSLIGRRIKRKAYILKGGKVMMLFDEGSTTIQEAFTSRPESCEYGVFEVDGKVILVDTTMWYMQEEYIREFDNTDAAIVAGVLLSN